jgi:prepilin-type processing-associated H-X9-DG protein
MMRTIVIVAILTIGGVVLSGLLLTKIGHSRASAERARCQDNLRRICTQYILPELETTKMFPAGTVDVAKLPVDKRLSWIVPGLRPMNHPELANMIDLTAPWDSDANRAAGLTFLPVLECPAALDAVPGNGYGPLHYPGIAGVGPNAATKPVDALGSGIFRFGEPTHLADVKDGLSNTLMLLETPIQPSPWIAGGSGTVRSLDPAQRPYLGPGRPFGGIHFGGANAAFADGSAHFLADSISPRALELLAGIADGDKPQDSQ